MQKEKPLVFYEKLVNSEGLFPIKGQELKRLLHRSIVAITCLGKNKQNIVGSGVLISKDIVLTAAHNLYCRRQGYQHENLKLYFGVDGIAKHYYQVEGIRYMQEFKTCEDDTTPFDFALLKLKKQVQYNEFLKIYLPCPTCLLNNNKQTYLQIFGFPGNYEQNYKPLDKYGHQFRLCQYGLAREDRIISIDTSNSKICYGISTLGGQSGCPVVINKQIIAIHVGGGKEHEQFNVGRLIDDSLLKKLQIWCEQLKGQPFQTCSKKLCPHIQLSNLEKKMDLSFSRIKQISLSEQQNLTHLDLRNNQLSSIDVTKNISLTHLNLSYNQLYTIDVTKNINLTQLNLVSNHLSAIDISKNVSLTQLNLGSNKFDRVDASKNINLTQLNLGSNQLSVIDVTKNNNLSSLYLHNNNFTKISLTLSCSLPIDKYMKGFVFSHQQSAVCNIQIECNIKDEAKCNQLKMKWEEMYLQPSGYWFWKRQNEDYNYHGCKYIFTVIIK